MLLLAHISQFFDLLFICCGLDIKKYPQINVLELVSASSVLLRASEPLSGGPFLAEVVHVGAWSLLPLYCQCTMPRQPNSNGTKSFLPKLTAYL